MLPKISLTSKLLLIITNQENIEVFILEKNNFELTEGTNTIAVQVFNVSNTSSDFYLNMKLEGIIALPESDAVIIDASSGFYNNPFSAKITTTEPGEKIKFTLDGSDPRNSSTAITSPSPLSVNIDPNSTEGGRGKTGGVILRATHFHEGFAPAKPVTRNYIFVETVKTQQYPGGSWPNDQVNGQVIDLLMDPDITGDPRFRDLMPASLLDIPTISVSTDPANLFGPEKGIYVNAQFHGQEWERPANIELIYPDGTPGFNIDAGIRIRGGWSRHGNYPKHAFRIFFRSIYGEGKLDYPLFGDEGVDEFDKIDLRTSQNYSWANGGNEAQHNTMNRDVFSRDCQKDMNQPYTRSRYYHLYLNGLYWGVFQTQERAEADFAESYFGGDKDDYDVVKVDIGEDWDIYEVEATDGNLEAWEEVWKMCQSGFISNLNYFKLMGRNYSGEADTSKTVWVDVDNLIDYMLTIFYAGNFDAPVSKFSNNYNPNNFFAIYNREDKSTGFKFLIHDAEHSLLTDPIGPGIGLQENRVNIGTISNARMNVTSFEKFQPQWLHFKLSENKEYRIKFADHVYSRFFNNGAFTVDSCISRFKETSDQLDLAIIAESARWGDQGSWKPKNKTDDWLPAVNRVINDYMPYRTEIVLTQLKQENLYPDVDPPIFNENGVEIIENKKILSGKYNFTLLSKNQGGTIIYTIDGTDPRTIGGAVSETAMDGGNLKSISVVSGNHVMARIKKGDEWSALHEMIFEDSGLFDNLKITELHYHPVDQGEVDDKELEFLELKNIGSASLDLSGLSFTDGITLTFPEGTTIGPGAFVVIASNMDEFNALYGFPAAFGYTGSLSNSGEKVVLETAAHDIVISVTFSDDEPWPVETDGDGYSLVSVETNPHGDPNLSEYWTTSKELNGSPYEDDANSVPTATPVFTVHDFNLNVYPNPASSSVTLSFSLETNENIEIGLTDFNGRFLHSLLNESVPAGVHSKLIQLSRLNLNAGIYLITFKSQKNFITKKLVYTP